MEYADGSRYAGAWESDKHHGRGVVTWANGASAPESSSIAIAAHRFHITWGAVPFTGGGLSSVSVEALVAPNSRSTEALEKTKSCRTLRR